MRTWKMLAAAALVAAALLPALRSAPADAQGGVKRLILALEEDPPLVNPAITSIIQSWYVGCPMFSALIHINRDWTVEPELAERWMSAPDGKSHTFYLRKDVKWHDGHPFTSADVKFSFENANAKLHPWGRGTFSQLDRVDTPDDYTVVVRLKQPFAPFMLGVNVTTAAILPKHVFEGGDITKNPANQKPIGTGPFKLKEWVKGDHITLVKNESYFHKGRPQVDELVFKIIPDGTARVAAFEKGDVDVVYQFALPLAEARRLAALPGVTMSINNNRGSAYLGIFNLRAKPLSDVKVRRAIAMAIDRKFMLKNIQDNFGEMMLGPVPPASPLYNKSLKDYPFEPAKANAMLDEAGYPKGADGTRFGFDFLEPSADAPQVKIGEVVRINLAAVGIKVNLVPLERAAMQQRAYVDLAFGMLVDSYGLGPDPAIGVERLYNSNNIRPVPFTNSAAYRNAEVDKLFAEEKLLMDPAKRKKVYDRIQELIWSELPILPFYAHLGPSVYRSSYVTGLFGNSAARNVEETFEYAKIVGK